MRTQPAGHLSWTRRSFLRVNILPKKDTSLSCHLHYETARCHQEMQESKVGFPVPGNIVLHFALADTASAGTRIFVNVEKPTCRWPQSLRVHEGCAYVSPQRGPRPHRCLYQCTLASVYRKMHHACVHTPTVIKNGLQKHIRIRILPNGADGRTGLFSSRFFHDIRSSLSGILYILSGMHLCPIFRRQVSHRVYFTLSDHFFPLCL